MSCCNDENVEKGGESRSKFQQKIQSQPIKFKLLNLLGLKKYLIDRYVFSRSEPKYQIIEEQDQLTIKTQSKIPCPYRYTQIVSIIQDNTHSIPVVLLQLKDQSESEGTVIYSHGNSSDLASSLSFITKFAINLPKYNYIVYDYTGYGKSKKTEITEESISQDLQLLISYLRLQDEDIILWGFSLGTYPTAKVARNRKLKGVILQSPLASIYSLFADQLTPSTSFKNDCFSLIDCIAQIQSFLVIIHSSDDEIIPFSHARTLFQRYRIRNSNPFCFLLEVNKLKHNQMHSFLSDKQPNSVKNSLHQYLKLMSERGDLSKAKLFQLQKQKYFDNLGDLKDAEYLKVDQQKILSQSQQQKNHSMHSQINFTALKQQRQFEFDDVDSESIIELNYYMEIKTFKHNSYFKKSGQAKQETEVSSIQHQEEIEQFYD